MTEDIVALNQRERTTLKELRSSIDVEPPNDFNPSRWASRLNTFFRNVAYAFQPLSELPSRPKRGKTIVATTAAAIGSWVMGVQDTLPWFW